MDRRAQAKVSKKNTPVSPSKSALAENVAKQTTLTAFRINTEPKKQSRMIWRTLPQSAKHCGNLLPEAKQKRFPASK
jgi:hypothetical protein